MDFMNRIRKKILEKQLQKEKALAIVRKRKLEEEEQLQMIKDKIRSARELDLTPGQKKILATRKAKKEAAIADLKKKGKYITKKFFQGVDNINADLDRMSGVKKKTKKRKK